ncbi:MAG: cytochrome c oxidase assembly protein [Acidimicrobiales bacterium]
MAPLGVLAIVGAVVSVVAFDRRPSRSWRRVAQFAITIASWGVLWFATASAFSVRAMTSLPLHMIDHVIVMFAVPMGLIGSGAVRDWWWVLGVERRRRVLTWWYRERRWRVPRVVANPFVAAVAMNTAMVTAHVPGVFDFVMDRQWAMDWLMEPAFLFSGLFFFHYLVASTPRRLHVRLRVQLAMIAVTMIEMVVLAMAMAIFSRASWYHVTAMSMAGMGNAHAVHMTFAQQQLAAGVLWICGDIWAVPLIVAISRRLVARDGSLFAALERQVSGSTRSSV